MNVLTILSSISENSSHYYAKFGLPLTTSVQNTLKEWSEHKINVIFELSTLEPLY